ncbi:MAG: hypothetical protein HOF90_08245 [Euryarchaeota archaeon]|nr:hypothetical protein [Euryarchaeota archaeon]
MPLPRDVPVISDPVILARYPFLPQATSLTQKLALENNITLEELLNSPRMEETRTRGRLRLIESMQNKGGVDAMAMRDIHTEGGQMLESFSYSYARLIVAASEQEVLMSRWAQAEAERAEKLLAVDEIALPLIAETYIDQLQRKKTDDIDSGMNSEKNIWQIGMLDFIELCTKITGERWRLLNHNVKKGWVDLGDRRMTSAKQLARLLRERIKQEILQDVKNRMAGVTDELAINLAEPLGMVTNLMQRVSSERLEMSGVEQQDWPPCMRMAVNELNSGVNVNHFGRLFLASMAATIGLEVEAATAFFENAPDFNPGTTKYQIAHVYDRGYTPSGCSKLKLNHRCAVQIGDDRLCDQPWLDHPMKYLRAKQRRRMQEQQFAETQFAETQSASPQEIEKDKGKEETPSQTK